MGKMLYGPTSAYAFDDRTLAHLQLAIGQKLRRGESFFVSWADEAADGIGRTTIWMGSSVPLVFRFQGGKMPAINREWLETLVMSANGSHGLMLTAEFVHQKTVEP